MGWMSLVYILIGVLIGGVAGFFIARRYFMTYLKKNPPITEKAIEVMMMQMGRKPSKKQVAQIMKSMNPYMNVK